MQNIIIGIVALVAVTAGGWWLYTSGTLSGEGAPTENEEAMNETQQEQESATLKSLIGMTGSHRCEVESSTENSQSSGVVYIADGKMRGDFTSVANGTSIESHMIIEGNTNYVWSSAMSQGVKMTLDANAATQGQESVQTGVNPNAEVDYSCSTWSADASVFALPAGVEFIDLNTFMQGQFQF